MTAIDLFQWHPHATLFAGSAPLPRPPRDDGAPRHVRITQMHPTLEALGKALRSGASFSLSDTARGVTPHTGGTFLTFTSGSTGLPKGILRSHHSWIASFDVTKQHFGLAPGTVTACLGALGSSLTLYAVTEALYLGHACHALGGMTPAQQRRLLDTRAVTALYATPAQLRYLCSGKPKTALHHVGVIFCGGGALDEATRLATTALCPNARIHVFYGATETSFVTISDANTPVGSVGTPYPGVEVEIREGLVWVRSPYMFEGYASGGTIPKTPDGFITVGELGHIDDTGNLWLTGRANRQIQIADQTVSPEEIERFILAQTKTTTCAVLPVPDPLRSHRLIACVAGPENTEQRTDILTQTRDRFGPTIAPRAVHFVPNWPLLPSGKTDLRALTLLSERAV